jgi:long-chain acyl-CoA synthetase
VINDLFRRIVHRNPKQTAVVDAERRFTYKALDFQIKKLAQYFSNDLRIRKGERIAIFLPNCLEFISSFFALSEIGAVSIPLNPHLKEFEIESYIDTCHITAVITNSNLQPQWGNIPGRMEKGKFVVVDRLENSKKWRKNYFNGELNSDTFFSAASDTEVIYLSTSGTTGKPKILSRSHANLIAGAKNVSESLQITGQDRFLSVVPFHHANGFSNCMFLPIICGATVILLREFSARKLLETMRDEDITILFGSPFVFSIMTETVEKDCVFPGIRYYLSTGAPMPKGLKQEFRIKFGGILRQLYGSSETGTISIDLDHTSEDEASLGRPLNTVEVKVIDKDGKILPPSEAGELIVRSPAMTKGYINETELNEKVFHNGYFRTGDLGLLGADGRIYISGRNNRVINAAGVKVDPIEIENVLLSFPKVKEAFVVGVRNKRGIEIIKAILVAQPDCRLNEVIAYCRDKLADFKIPRIVEFKEELPKNILGKISPNI